MFSFSFSFQYRILWVRYAEQLIIKLELILLPKSSIIDHNKPFYAKIAIVSAKYYKRKKKRNEKEVFI
jgi:hypothetical protein